MNEKETTRGVCANSTTASEPRPWLTLGELLATDFSDVPLDQRLYGRWKCGDGREVLFNRDYRPIWQRYPGQRAEPADPDEWVRDIVGEAKYYWIDGEGTNANGRRLLKEWGVQ
jgi:hypothetical protein